MNTTQVQSLFILNKLLKKIQPESTPVPQTSPRQPSCPHTVIQEDRCANECTEKHYFLGDGKI